MTVPGGYIAGDVLSAANLNLLPGGKMGYAERTTDQTGITSVTDITSLTVTWTAVAARRYRTSVYLNLESSVAADIMEATITDGSSSQKALGVVVMSALTAENDYMTIVVSTTETGLSGSTTRKVRARRRSGTGSVALRAGATYPAHILVEDIGPA